MKKWQFIVIVSLLLGVIAAQTYHNWGLFITYQKIEAQKDAVSDAKQQILYEPLIIKYIPEIEWNDSAKYFEYRLILYNMDGTRVSDSYTHTASTIDSLISGLEELTRYRNEELLSGYYIEDFIPCGYGKMRVFFKEPGY